MENIELGLTYSFDVESIIIMVGSMALRKELRILHPDQ